MGWFSKVLGIDSRKHKEQDARNAAAKAQAAQDAAAAQAAQTAAQSKQYNDSMLEVQRQSLQASKDAAGRVAVADARLVEARAEAERIEREVLGAMRPMCWINLASNPRKSATCWR